MPDLYLLPKRVLSAVPALGRALKQADVWLLRGVFGLLARLPPARAERLAAALFGWFGPRGAQSEKVRKNLRIVFPDRDEAGIEQLTRESYRHVGVAAVELLNAPRMLAARDARFELVIEDSRIQPLRPGTPAVIVTAHVGAWQYVAMLGQLCGVRLTSLYAPEINPRVRPLFLRLREAMGCHWLSRDDSARALLKELAAGNCVGFATDTRFDQGRMVEFCGHEAMTNTAAARLALRFGCPLIAVRCDRLPGQRYRMVLARLIEPEPGCTDTDQQTLGMTREMNREFERWIRRDPGRWVCMKRRWPREPGLASTAEGVRAMNDPDC